MPTMKDLTKVKSDINKIETQMIAELSDLHSKLDESLDYESSMKESAAELAEVITTTLNAVQMRITMAFDAFIAHEKDYQRDIQKRIAAREHPEPSMIGHNSKAEQAPAQEYEKETTQ